MKDSRRNKEELSPFVRKFIKRVLNTVQKFDLWEKGDSFLVCVSGGPDSLCLLDILFLLSKKYHFTLHIAHVNYHLRGKDSILDEKLVRERAQEYSLPYTILSQKKDTKNPSEEKLRNIRYTFFEKTRKKQNIQHIAIAHNQNDQAETPLMRLLRGSGLSGLSAIKAKNGFIVRPPIEREREDILRYLKERHISFREDKSNAEIKYFRNQIRHILIPFLENHFQPKIRQILAQTALLLGEDYTTLENISTSFTTKKDSVTQTFSRLDILALSPALMTRELRSLLRPLLHGKNPSKALIDELIKALKSKKGKTQTITFQGLKFIRKGDTVRLLNF